MNSAEKQIAEFSGLANTKDWLVTKGMLDSSARTYGIEVMTDWERPGSESYVLDFVIHEESSERTHTKRYIAKACIKPPCTDTMNEWVRRRRAVEKAGVQTPQLYTAERAVLIEDYVPYSLEEAFRDASPYTQAHLASELINTYQHLRNHRFSPRLMHDLRTNGHDIVMVDFGEDLGPQNTEQEQSVFDRNETLRAILGKNALKL